MKIWLRAGCLLGILLALNGCAPKVGSDAWCDQMKAKPSGDWTANETADYARHCILR